MKAISGFVGKYMAFIVLGFSTLALFVPETFQWLDTSWTNYFLMIIMLGMGLTLKLEDFAIVFKRPRDLITGCIAQFTVMPLLAFVLGKAFGLEAGLLAGVILVGTCPGGTASNVITYLSKGDVALSVGMTSVNTLLAPVLTPAITYLLLRTSVTVDVVSMFLSIVKVVIVPIALGFLINRFWGAYTRRVSDMLPIISVAAITLIVAAIISHNAERILETGVIVFVVVILHNLLGFAVGLILSSLLQLPPARKKALSIEIGMQNSGLATSLAVTAFPNLAMATVPGAIFSVWHNISGSMLVGLFRLMGDDEPDRIPEDGDTDRQPTAGEVPDVQSSRK